MAVLTVEIDQGQEAALRQVLNREPGWNKSLVTRALLAYFLKLAALDQEKLVKTYGIRVKEA